MSLCNESKIVWDNEKNRVSTTGLPTEAALKVLTEKIGIVDSKFANSADI